MARVPGGGAAYGANGSVRQADHRHQAIAFRLPTWRPDEAASKLDGMRRLERWGEP